MKITISFLLVIMFACSGCGTFGKHKDKKDAKKKPDQEQRDQTSDVDFQAFLGRLRKAVASHDVNALAPMMTTDFGYRLNPEGIGDGVFKYWDENGLWIELEGILSEKFVVKGDFMVAPPQFADESSNYEGYRAGIRRVNGSWKFAYFVNG
ncbi:MAG: hypothetical protein ABJB22_02775 [Verrucomicrobiota bacterium]